MNKEAFIATGVGIALLVDFTRIPVYLRNTASGVWSEQGWLLLACVVAAFAGAWLGKRLLPKVTVRGVQLSVAILLLGIAVGLITGVI